jgi:catechol 2,3-dioxygenase-like lactoylglutathione lyase family enzyme
MVNLGLDHVHLLVKDLDESIEFYEDIGLEFVEYTSHGGKACMMKSPDGVLFELQETGLIENPGLNHMAFSVSDIDEFCDSLEARGLVVDGPLDNPRTGRRLGTIRDPHGFLWQFVQKDTKNS